MHQGGGRGGRRGGGEVGGSKQGAKDQMGSAWLPCRASFKLTS